MEIRVPKDQPDAQMKVDDSTEPQQFQLTDFEEQGAGDYIFENEWQSFRTTKNRSMELTNVYHEYTNPKGIPSGKKRYKIAVKVVDLFGNDTMKVIEVGV